jgi:hypothetical protein
MISDRFGRVIIVSDNRLWMFILCRRNRIGQVAAACAKNANNIGFPPALRLNRPVIYRI